jgi:glucosylceramidase
MKQVIMNTTIFGENGIEQEKYETGLITDTKEQEMFVVNLYPQKTYQTIDGFGAALTESAGYTLSKLSKENYDKIVEAYYGKDGIGYTLGRIHMDSCDFSLSNYCAVEKSDDPEFKDFNLDRDAKYVQPLVKKCSAALGRDVCLLLSPWSPPAFMKDTGVRNGGGHLKKECYQSYADYIAKYITEYKKLGIPISSLTVQNEPLAVQTWDSCEYSPDEEKEFLRDYLYPTLQNKGLGDIKLYIWDHNKERVYERAKAIVDDTTKGMVEGVAFHWYSGDHFNTLQMVREDYPNLKLMHSEGCVELARYGAAAGNDMIHAQKYAHDIIGDLNHGMNSWIDWNLVLDEIGGPNHVKNYCGAPIICDTNEDKIEVKPMFHAISHFSKYIKPGAVRIGCSSFSSELEITAAKNIDGSLVLVIMSNASARQMVQLRVEGKITRLLIPSESISTIIIN